MLKLKLLQDSVGQTISSTNPFTLTTVAVCIQSMPSFIPATSNLSKMQCWYSSFYVYWLLCWSFIEDPVTGTTYFSTHDYLFLFWIFEMPLLKGHGAARTNNKNKFNRLGIFVGKFDQPVAMVLCVTSFRIPMICPRPIVITDLPWLMRVKAAKEPETLPQVWKAHSVFNFQKSLFFL